jgi:hypothetical protein
MMYLVLIDHAVACPNNEILGVAAPERVHTRGGA